MARPPALLAPKPIRPEPVELIAVNFKIGLQAGIKDSTGSVRTFNSKMVYVLCELRDNSEDDSHSCACLTGKREYERGVKSKRIYRESEMPKKIKLL